MVNISCQTQYNKDNLIPLSHVIRTTVIQYPAVAEEKKRKTNALLAQLTAARKESGSDAQACCEMEGC